MSSISDNKFLKLSKSNVSSDRLKNIKQAAEALRSEGQGTQPTRINTTKTTSIFSENKQVDNGTVSYNDFAQDITGKDFDDLNKTQRDQIICFLMQKNTLVPKKQMPISLHNT